MSIKKSLQSSILLSAVIPVVLIAVSTYIVMGIKYTDINKENIKNIAYDYSRGFSSQLGIRLLESQSLSEDNAIQALLLENRNSTNILSNTSSDYYKNVNQVLTNLSNHSG